VYTGLASVGNGGASLPDCNILKVLRTQDTRVCACGGTAGSY
jgi:hypothetical protein